MSYELEFAGNAAAYLKRLDGPTQRRFANALRLLANDPIGRSSKQLHGRIERSLRVGGWRVLYTVDTTAQTITIKSISTRGQAYRGR
jgi:mRNA interferase RelE/StbE